MESMNKFKFLTILIVCMFFFIVAAIYSNTKDASANKTKINNDIAQEQLKSETKTIISENQNTSDIDDEINLINARLDELNDKLAGMSSRRGSLKCKIYGTMGERGPVELSSKDAIREATDNDRDLVINCSF